MYDFIQRLVLTDTAVFLGSWMHYPADTVLSVKNSLLPVSDAPLLAIEN